MRTKPKRGRPAGSKGTPWIRIEAAIASDARVIRAGMLGGLVFRALLEMSKLHGWRGVIPSGDIDGVILWKYLNADPCEATPDQLSAAFERVVTVGLVTPSGDGRYVIRSWAKYQKDGMDRKEDESGEIIPNDSESLETPDVTGRDVTGRDLTGRDETEKTPPKEETPPLGVEPSIFGKAETAVGGSLGHELRLLLSGKGGDAPLAKWVSRAQKLIASGATVSEIREAVKAAKPIDEPWDAFAALKAKYQTQKEAPKSHFPPKGEVPFEPAPRPVPVMDEATFQERLRQMDEAAYRGDPV